MIIAAWAAGAAGAAPVALADASDFRWTAPYMYGSGSNNYATALCRAPAGSLYVAGNVGFTQGASSSFAARLRTTDGTRVWKSVLPDRVVADAVSDSAHALTLVGSTGSGKGFAIKYSSAGTVLWKTYYLGAGGSHAYFTSVATDAAGNVYAAGSTNVATRDAVVVKYDATGHFKWKCAYATGGDDKFVDVAVDGAGSVYVCGPTNGYGQHTVANLIKLSAAGKKVWSATIPWGSSYNGFESMTVKLGSVFVAGQHGTNLFIPLAAKYNATSGKRAWVVYSRQAADRTDHVRAMAVDSHGAMTLVGFCSNPGTPAVSPIGTVLALQPNGARHWTTEFFNAFPYAAVLDGVAVDSAGNVYASGLYGFGPAYADSEAVVVRYTPEGPQEATTWFMPVLPGPAVFVPLLVVDDTHVYAGGHAGLNTGEVLVVQSLKQKSQ